MKRAMAPIDALREVALSPAHLSAALALSAEAGWNQTGDDWRLMIRHGRAIGLEAPGGRLVASALALPYGGRFAWISMVLVTADWRRKGLASRLMRSCIDWLLGRGLVPVLDATPAGRTVYGPLGFAPAFALSRMEAEMPRPAPAGDLPVRRLAPDDLPAIVRYDAEIFGADRSFILADLAARAPALALVADAPRRGFVLGRPGRSATQIGPIVADGPRTAVALLAAALAAAPPGPVFIDVPDAQGCMLGYLERSGFRLQRPYTRMIHRRAEPFGDPGRTHAIAGPELG